MSGDSLRDDIGYLAAHLEHRGAHTDQERMAAEYLHGRFGEHTTLTDVDDFHSIESQHLLLATYYAEFLVVAVLASFIPWGSLAYGAIVFVMYIAELTGFRVLGRLMPQYDSQNVSARFIATEPERVVVVTANYDSPRVSNIEDPQWFRFVRPAQLAMVWCMLLILASCATEGMEIFAQSTRYDVYLRWICALVLFSGAARMYTLDQRWEFTRGPIENASGAAVLLALAERAARDPFERTDLWLVATGAKESGLAGMQHFLRHTRLDRKSTYFINVAHVGAGALRFVEKEGLMHAFPADKELLEAARDRAPDHGVEGITHRWWPTDALVPLARGYKTTGVVGVGEDGLPVQWSVRDTRTNVDYDRLENAVDYVESILRKLDSMPSPHEKR